MNLALFDFDGTITVGDTFIPFLRFSASRSRAAIASLCFSPFLVAARAGLLSARTARPLAARFAFQGRRGAAVRGLGRVYADEVLPSRVRRRALERLDWHKRQGDTIVVVSASLDAYLTRWCESIGVDVICTELEERGGRLTGRYVGGDCSGAEKVRRIRERYDLSRYSTIYAYGDSGDDREMLAVAHVRYYQWAPIDGVPAELT